MCQNRCLFSYQFLKDTEVSGEQTNAIFTFPIERIFFEVVYVNICQLVTFSLPFLDSSIVFWPSSIVFSFLKETK